MHMRGALLLQKMPEQGLGDAQENLQSTAVGGRKNRQIHSLRPQLSYRIRAQYATFGGRQGEHGAQLWRLCGLRHRNPSSIVRKDG